MPPRRRTSWLPWVATGLALFMTAHPLADMAGPTATATAACDEHGWRALHLPGAGRSIGMDVEAASGHVRWVAGMHAGRGIPRRPWIAERTRHGWRSVVLPSVGADAGLTAIDAGRGGTWAVGFSVTGTELRPVALRRQGVDFVDASPDWAAGGTATLTDVSAARETWAVGYRTTGSGPRPYALRWRRGGWIRQDPALGPGRFGALTAVAAVPGSGTWAAGWVSRGRLITPLMFRWTGKRWVHEVLPSMDGGEAVITGLRPHAGRMWATGYLDSGSPRVPFVLRREDGVWSMLSISGRSISMLADDLVVSTKGAPTLVGSSRRQDASLLAHSVAHATGHGLQVVRRPAAIRGNSHLRAIAGDGRRLVAVGWTDGRALVLRSCGRSIEASGASSEPRPRVTEASSLSAAARAQEPRQGGDRDAAPPGPAKRAAALDVRFRDVAADVGLDMATVTYRGAVLDINGDGWDDILISRHQGRARVLINRNGRFRPAPADPLPGKDRHGCSGGDVDGDGRDDAFCAIGASRGVKFKANELILDLMGPTARNAAGVAGVSEPIGRGRRAAFVQADGDGVADLLVSNDPLRVDGLPSLDRLYLGDGVGGFRPAPELGLDLPTGGECAFSAQLDGGAHAEVAVCTTEPWHGRAGLHIFRRQAGVFVDATRSLGLSPQADIDAVAADFDADGRLDLAQLSRSRLVVSLGRGGRYSRLAAIAVSDGRALAAGDVNADGRADLYVVQGGPGNQPDLLLLSIGRGLRRVAIPQTRSGGGDDVIALDHDHNGLDDFLVLNGRDRAGPVQLIAAFRR